MEGASREADAEPAVKQYGFTISASARAVLPPSEVETGLPVKDLQKVGLGSKGKGSIWAWPKRLTKPQSVQHDGKISDSAEQAPRSLRGKPLHRETDTDTIDWTPKKNLQTNTIDASPISWADDPVSPTSSERDEPLNLLGRRRSIEDSSSRASGFLSLGERKSTGDSKSWALGSSWQREESPEKLPEKAQSLFNIRSPFRGFKDDCEAGSFTLGNTTQGVQSNGRIEVVGTLHLSEGVRSMVKQVVGGLRAWQQPEASDEGLGGTYFFMNELGQKQAIVKPCDEEPLAPNNPKGFVGRELGEPGMKPTVRVGEAAMREVAAFLLDHEHFANVPATVLVRVTHNCFHVAPKRVPILQKTQSAQSRSEAPESLPRSSLTELRNTLLASAAGPSASPAVKLASMQEFVSHQGDSSEIGSSRFSAHDVHRIGILDLRLFNTDRHSGNMLVNHICGSDASHSWLGIQYELIPIDHGFCLPEALEPPYFEWMHWSQAKLPFDSVELAYIAELDATADVQFLKAELPWIPEGSLRILQVATLLLKECAAAGLTLFEIATIASRPIVGMDEEPSELERMCFDARQKAELPQITLLDQHMEDNSDGIDQIGHDILDELPDSPVGNLLPGKKSLIMGHETIINTQLSGDDMMFSLDEETESGPMRPEAVEEDEELQFSDSAFMNRSHESLKEHNWRPTEGSMIATDFAKSLFAGIHPHVQANMRHQKVKSGFANHRQRSNLRRGHDPLPVNTDLALDSISKIFDNLESPQWLLLMRTLQQSIQLALDEGKWQQSTNNILKQNVGFGVSCPRF